MFLLCVAMRFCDRIDSSINRGLEEEKSYSRHAMEYHRHHPDKRAGDTVLETWSTADYVAQAVAAAKIPGDWASLVTNWTLLNQRFRGILEATLSA